MTALEPRAVEGLAGRRVLVTGGAGFIGSTLCHTLARSGADVTVYDNLATGSLDNLRDGAEVPPPRFLHGDVRDRERLARVLGGVDVVYHLACLGVRHSIHSPHENLDVNARGTLTVLTQALEARPARVVHVSSSEVYGTARTVPMSEDHPTDPSTVYGAGKLAGECCARALHRCDGLDVVVLRPFNAYGPGSHFEGDSGEVIPRFVVRALSGEPLVVFGDGTQTRDLSHVHDTAATIARAGVVEGIAGRTLNIGT
ncbi:MAG TPA: SDR family NAD(P)-dependent oxidoreductase, partial [Candidatus Dormibacteraeota bacterium]|nr:SDR family NAD(P)-dependent oxidoreductase [Candidatus Dormibacteraeota bacterium]